MERQLDAIAVMLEIAEEGKFNQEVTVTEKPNMQATSLAEKDVKKVNDNYSKDDDASVQLLKESMTTYDVIDADSTSVVVQSKESESLMFPFVGGVEIENATEVLECCRGAGAALDEKHSPREEIQVLQLQQAASNGWNIQVTLYKCDRETL
jgi:hypothetical protein